MVPSSFLSLSVSPLLLRVDEEWAEDEDGGGEQLDDHVEGGACRVLERVADCVPRDGGLVGLAVLPAVVAQLDVLLGVVPRAADWGGQSREGAKVSTYTRRAMGSLSSLCVVVCK